MGITERICEYLDFKKITRYRFYKETGLSNGFLDKGGNIGSDKCERIIYQYKDLDPDWLLTGKGSMLRATTLESPQTATQPKNDDIIALLKEQLQEKDKKIERQAQEIGQLKQQITDLRDGRGHSSDAGDVGVAGVG